MFDNFGFEIICCSGFNKLKLENLIFCYWLIVNLVILYKLVEDGVFF